MTPAAILYYFPGAASALGAIKSGLSGVPEELRGRFLTHTKLDNSPGPDGGRGLLLTWQQNVLISYQPDTQTWQRSGTFWRGIRNDYASEEFAKPHPPAEGYRVPLGDGREYTIPVALADAPNYTVPWRDTLDDEGKLTRTIDPAYAAVCRAADLLWDHITTDGTMAIDEHQLRLACANAIAVNYQLDLTDCLFLGLFTTESYQALIRAVLDMPALEDLLKKKAPEPYAIASGAPESSSTTAPPTPTSRS